MPSILRRMMDSLRGWRALLLVLAVLALLAWADRRIMDSAPLHGLRPKNSDWIVSTTDFPAFWKRVEHSDVFERMEDDWSRPQAHLELLVRQRAGIRPTPFRWRIWMGQRLTLAHSSEGTGLCVFPGLLLRTVAGAGQLMGFFPDAQGVRAYRDSYYAWQDGFLVVSNSHAYVQACLSDGDVSPLRSGIDGELAVQWKAPYEGFVRTQPGQGLRVAGAIKAPFSDGDRPLSLTSAWPSPPLAVVTVRRIDDLKLLGSLLERAAGAITTPTATPRVPDVLWQHWGVAPLPDRWDIDIDHLALMLDDVDNSATLPIPNGTLVLRSTAAVSGPHPLAGLAENHRAIPYEWKGQPGVYIPLLGEQFSLCLGQYGRDWIATINEREMAALVGALTPGPVAAADVDVTIRVSWSKAARVAKSLILQAAELELIPGLTGEDAQQKLPSVADALGRLGTLNLDGRAGDGWLSFEGVLFRPENVEGA